MAINTAVRGSELYFYNTEGNRNSVVSQMSFRMDVTRVGHHVYIKIVVLRGRNARKCHSELVEVMRNNSLPYRTVARWAAAFQRGCKTSESHTFCTMLDLQLILYCPLCDNTRDHYPLLQCLRTTSAILASAHSYFVVSSFKYEGKIVAMT